MKIILFGMPASGKDTQAEILSKKFNLPHISTGKIFRDEMAAKSELGLKIDSLMKAGKFVDDDTTIDIVKNFLDKSDKFILNGFPRNLKQSKWFNTYCENNAMKIDHYVYFDITEDEARKRITSRSKIENRPEDSTVESLDNRFNIYKNDTKPGIDYFCEKDNFISIQSKLPKNMITTMLYAMIKGPDGRYL